MRYYCTVASEKNRVVMVLHSNNCQSAAHIDTAARNQIINASHL